MIYTTEWVIDQCLKHTFNGGSGVRWGGREGRGVKGGRVRGRGAPIRSSFTKMGTYPLDRTRLDEVEVVSICIDESGLKKIGPP